MATKELIAAATVNRVISREGKVLGYLVKSNSNDDYYQVTGSSINGKCHYFCTCKAGANGFKNCKDGACCHVKAVKEVVAARRELAKELGNCSPATAVGCLGETEQAEQVEKLDPMDAELAVTGVALLAHYAEQAEVRQAVTADLKKAVFAVLKQQYDFRLQVKPAPVATAPAPIAERGTLNPQKAFSLLR